ncbi:MAG TPA: YceI family protein [Gammaproteobacteria bacterium]|nr:YceI family protein [Gammaproteobacteria bacterium]
MRFTTLGVSIVVVAQGMLAGAAAGEPARYELDPAHTTIAFLVEHAGYAKTLGQFLRSSGGYTFDDATDALSDVRVVVETASVDTHHEARDRHLKSGDFLDSESHREMTFTAASARRTGESTFEVTGELTLLGTRRPLTLEAIVNKSAPYPFGDRVDVMGVSARGTLKRSDFGMAYGVADDVVGDDVEIVIELEARRQ